MFNRLAFIVTLVLFQVHLLGQPASSNEINATDTLAPPILIYPTGGIYLNNTLVTLKWQEGDLLKAVLSSTPLLIKYVVEVGTDPSFLIPTVVDTVVTTSDTVLLSEGCYYWRVKAFDLTGSESDFSSPDSFGIDVTYPSEPALVSPVDGSFIQDRTPEFIWRASTDNLSGVDHYVLQYADHPNLNYGATSINTSDTTYTPLSPLPDTTYYWRVMAVDKANNEGCWSVRWSFTVTTAGCPDIPVPLFPADSSYINDMTPTFIWTKVAGAGLLYSLQYAMNENFQGKVTIDSIPDTVYTITDTLLDTTYYWRVEAVNPFDCHSGWSRPFTFTIDTTLPSIPTLISPEDSALINDNTPTFVWTHTASVGGHYILQYTSDSSFTSGVITIDNIADTSYTISTAIADTTYYWRVEAVDYAGNHSGYQPHPFMFTVYTQVPNIPMLISPEDSSFTNDNTPTFVWTAVIGLEITYTLEYSLDNIFLGDFVRVSGITDTTYTIPNVLALIDTTYYWRVEAVDAAGNHSGYQLHPFMFTVDTEPPAVPALIAPEDSSLLKDNTPTFIWSATAGLYGSYTLQYTLDSNFIQDVVTITNISDTSYTVTDTLEDNTYYWRVEAVDAAGNHSGYQLHPFMFTVDTEPPGIPVLIQPQDYARINDNTPTFVWSATVDDEGSYTLQYALNSTFPPFITVTVENISDTSYTIPDTLALPDGTYYWRVEAVDAAGNHSGYQLHPFMFTVDTWPPDKPTLIAPQCDTILNYKTIEFVWSTVAGCATYALQYALNYTFTLGVVTIPRITDTTYTLTLSDGIYYWRVEAIDYAGNHSGYTLPCKLTIDTQGPCPPTLISPADHSVINDRTPRFVWTPTAGAGGYYVLEWAIDSLFTKFVTTIDSIPYNRNRYTIPESRALGDTTWYWHVDAVDCVGNHSGYQAHPFMFIVDTGLPPKPILIAPPNNTITNNRWPTFVWSSTAGVGGYYRLQYAKNKWFTQDLVTISHITDTTYTVTDGLADGEYYWRVEAVDQAGNHSGYQDIYHIFKFTIDTEAPCPPTLQTPCDAVISDNTPKFVWTLNLGPGETYTLQYARDSMFTQDVVTVTDIVGNTYTVPDTLPLSDGTWYWHVETVDQAGNHSGYSLWCAFHIFTALPNIPTLIEPKDDTTIVQHVVEFIWSSTAGSGGYYILEYALNNAFTEGVVTIFTAETTYIDTLPLDTTYYWHVDAVNQAGSHSGYQPQPFKFTIGVIGPPPAPTVTISVTDKDKLLLQWTNVDADSYNVYRDTIACFTPIIPIRTGIVDTFYIDSTPGIVGDPSTNYFYYIKAVSNNIESDTSNQVGEFDFGLITTPTGITNWNNIAMALVLPTVDSASELMHAVPACSSVARWNATLQTFDQYIPGVPGAPDFEVLPGYPYYVYVTKDTVWTLTGELASPVFYLITTPPGMTNWNEITLPLCEITIDSASELMHAVTACSSVARWNAVLQTYDQYIPGVPGAPDFEVLPGYPYQVYVTASSTWPGGGKHLAFHNFEHKGNTKLNSTMIAVPHLVCGYLRTSNGKVPQEVYFEAYISSHPQEVLTQKSPGCHYSDGVWIIQVASFSKPWKVGDTLHVNFKDNESNEESAIDVCLSCRAYDEVKDVQLSKAVNTELEVYKEFAMAQNYPNPFTDNTQICYYLADDTYVTLLIHNVVGQLVRTLVNEYREAGYYVVWWDGTDDSNKKVKPGIYFYTVTAGKHKFTRKMMLIR